MSRTEHRIGKIREVVMPEGTTTNEFAGALLLEDGIKEIPDYYNDNLEYLTDELYEQFHYHRPSDTLYEIIEDMDYDDEEIIIATDNGDGTINFNLKFYNGGAGFGECLDEALGKLNKDKS
tara:strand:- start:16918 stop:17280 length:363 start_codon:yes stop_codon:yes gene_type:complete